MMEIDGLGYKEIILDNYEDFIELIRPDRENLKQYLDSHNYKLMYRGQADANWELEPSLFRNVSKDTFLSNSYDGICFMHWVTLKTFVEGCDLNSVVVPFDSFEFRSEFLHEFDERVVFDTKCWPNPKLYELLAYAQHYGVWTELLDWSKNPLVACYFACSQVVKNKKNDGLMSIWVFDTEKKNLLNDHTGKNVEIIEVPKSVNQNISSQQGCFTLVRQNLERGTKLTFVETTKRIQEIKLLNELIDEKGVNGLLKISIPHKFAPDILKYCSAYSINAATIFRGIEGAATYAKESISIEEFRNKIAQSD